MPLSRRQLAAALLEYDNDDEAGSSKPRVNHRESALFLPFVPAPRPTSLHHPPEPSFQRKNIQSRASHTSERKSIYSTKHTNDPNVDENEEDGDIEGAIDDHVDQGGNRSHGVVQDVDVDVSRWDLPSHLVSQTEVPISTSPRTSGLEQPFPPSSSATALENLQTRSVSQLRPAPEHQSPSRAVSLHLFPSQATNSAEYHDPSLGDSDIDAILSRASRIRQFADPDSGERVEQLEDSPRRRTISFESSRTRRTSTKSPLNPTLVPLPASPASYARPLSSLSQSVLPHVDSRPLNEDSAPNPFALPPPPAEVASRFDPKTIRAQRDSMTSSTSRPRSDLATTRPISSFALAEANYQYLSKIDSHTSPHDGRFEHAEHLDKSRSEDMPTGDVKVYDDIPSAAEYGRPLRPSKYGPRQFPFPNRQSMLRPASLIMPAPLSGLEEHPPVSDRSSNVPEGWTLGERPLPPGSRSSILISGSKRPGIPMSLSSRTFRSSLMVDGIRDEYFIGGAEQEGDVGIPSPGGEEDQDYGERRPGKLFGTSLMDQLEARKAAIRGKQRVFTGDARPAMMARSCSYATALSSFPETPAAAVRPVSMVQETREPLLQFDDNGQIVASNQNLVSNNRITKSKSVFGVDQIWEKEMAKLKIMEEEAERQRVIDAEKNRLQELEDHKKKRKGKGKVKVKTIEPRIAGSQVPSPPTISPIKISSDAPPVLQYSPEKAPHPEYFPQESPTKVPRRASSRAGIDQWDDDSDDENEPRLSALVKGKGKAGPPIQSHEDSSGDEDENVPLSKLAPPRSVIPPKIDVDSDDDPEEDVPLSKIANRSTTAVELPAISSQTALGLGFPTVTPALSTSGINDRPDENKTGDDDDDVPLLLRHARAQTFASLEGHRAAHPEDMEDDLPLGYKHAEAAQRQMSQNIIVPAPLQQQHSMGNWWSSRASTIGGGFYPAPPQPSYPTWGGMPYLMANGFALPPPPSPYNMPFQHPHPLSYVDMMMPSGLEPDMHHAQEESIDRWRREIRTPSMVTMSTSGAGGSVK